MLSIPTREANLFSLGYLARYQFQFFTHYQHSTVCKQEMVWRQPKPCGQFISLATTYMRICEWTILGIGSVEFLARAHTHRPGSTTHMNYVFVVFFRVGRLARNWYECWHWRNPHFSYMKIDRYFLWYTMEYRSVSIRGEAMNCIAIQSANGQAWMRPL